MRQWMGLAGLVLFFCSEQLMAADFYTDRYALGFDPNSDPLSTQGWDNFSDPNDEFIAKSIPFTQNDTSSVAAWSIYISGWDMAPPDAMVLKVFDDRPYLIKSSSVDIIVKISDKDPDGNVYLRTSRIVKGVPVQPGETAIPIEIHNEIGQIIHARITSVRNRSAIKLFD
ncbi:MAG: hypothetical protein ACPGF7_04800 [Pontibacterium sp.]